MRSKADLEEIIDNELSKQKKNSILKVWYADLMGVLKGGRRFR